MARHNAAAALERAWARSERLRRMTSFRFLAFCVAGTLGFLADVAVLSLVADSLGLYLGRVVSFMVAVTVTWIVNRYLAFRDRRSGNWLREWGRFIAANSTGAMVNYGTYAVMVATLSVVAANPAIGVAAGSIAGLVLNFTTSHLLVFEKRQDRGEGDGRD